MAPSQSLSASFTQTIRSWFRSKSSNDHSQAAAEDAQQTRQAKRSLSKPRDSIHGLAENTERSSQERSSRMKLEKGSAEEAAQVAQKATPSQPSSQSKPDKSEACELSDKEATAQAKDAKSASPEVVELIRSFFQAAENSEANRYTIKEIIGKGSYGVVASAVDNFTGEKVAIKRVSNIFECVADAVRILREIKLLRLLRHADIVDIKHIMLPPDSSHYKDIYIVFELMESDLHNVIKMNQGTMTNEHFQFFLYQMLRGLMYIHSAKVFHRDLKPRNILANANCKLKICDLGLARPEFLDTPQSMVMWTDYVATRWYRAPELCGTFCSKYTTSVDMWSMGCIFAEIMLGRPLFPGKNIAHQMELITDITGTPPPQTLAKIRNDRTRRYLASMGFKPKANLRRLFPRADRDALVLLEQMLSFDPDLRPTAEEALNDPYFDNLRDPAREPLSDPVSKLDFAFENQTLSAQDARNLIYEEILEYHPRVKEDYLKNRQSSFANPSAIDAFKRQFMRLEQLGSGDGPMDSKVGRTISLQRRALQNSVSLPKQASVSSSFFNPIRGGGGGDGGCSSIKSPADARQKKNATVYAEAEGGAWDGEIIEAADDDNRSNCIDGRSSWSPSLDTRYPTSLGQSRQESAEDAKPDETVAPIMSPPWPQPISSVSGPSGSSTLAQRFSTPGLVDLPPFSPGTLSLWGPSAAAAVAECQALALAAGSTCEAATPPPSATATNNNGNGLAFHGLSDSYAFVPQAVASTASPGRIRGHSTSGSSSPLRKGRRSVSGMRKSFLARNVAEVGLQTKEVVGAEIIQK